MRQKATTARTRTQTQICTPTQIQAETARCVQHMLAGQGKALAPRQTNVCIHTCVTSFTFVWIGGSGKV